MAAGILSLEAGASLNSEDWKCYLGHQHRGNIRAMKIYELSKGMNLKGHW